MIKFNYSTKNKLIGSVGLILSAILIIYISGLAKYSPVAWVIVVIPLLILISLIKRRTDNFASGQIGENDIDRELKNLGSNYICITRGLDTGHGNIDKIVIGPTGIWTLEIKSHRGNITLDGQSLLRDAKPLEKNFLGQAYAEAMSLQEFIKSKINLDIRVQPVLVFANKHAKVRLGLKEFKGVYVVQKAWLNKLLTETNKQYLAVDVQLKIKDIVNHKQ